MNAKLPSALALLAAAAACGGCAAASPEHVRAYRVPFDPAVLSPLRHGEGMFAGKDGVRLFEQFWWPVGRPRAVLVIVHGLKDHGSRYADVAERLARSGFAVYAPDLRGHGRSDGDRAYVERFDDYLDDLEVFLARVRGREPGRPIFLFGHSMGGAIAALYAIERKPALAGLVLSAPALRPGGGSSSLLVAATKTVGAAFPRLAVMDLPDEQFSRDPGVVAAMAEDPLIEQGNGPARTAAELLSAMARIDERAEEIVLPLLVLHGTADRVTDPGKSREFVERARSTEKSIRLYEGLAHDLLHEPERATVAADLEAWLEANAPAR
jgi:acylglycerol lipase